MKSRRTFIQNLYLIIWLIVFLYYQPSLYSSEIDFNRQIRPILSENCFQCHGPDEKHRKGGLRLDTKDGLFALSKSGFKNISPGDANKSELIHRIDGINEELMPPIKSGKKLSLEQKFLIKQWVNQEAKYAEHWAFISPKKPPLPMVINKNWVQNPIDSFILHRLEQKKISPSSSATKETLIRRLSLDLIGLPPTLKQIDDFVADQSPEAYEKVVDRLLGSDHFGERMAMQWLDYARFADSNGFQTDTSRSMWPWRDWVINAFNTNMPFDQFTISQIAGDMLPNATKSQILATGFNRNHRLNGEGGIIAEEWRIENVIDRVDTTSQTWLGLTLGCARCHDHKYDPISQKEFYNFFAFFNNLPENGALGGNRNGGNTDPVEVVSSPIQEKEIADLELVVKEQEKKIVLLENKIDVLIQAWEKEFKEKIKSTDSVWSQLNPSQLTSLGMAKFSKLPDDTYLATGKNPNQDTYTFLAPLAKGKFSGLLLECFPDPSLPNQSLGRFSNGNFVLSKIDAEVSSPFLNNPIKIQFQKAFADYSQKNWDISNVLKNNPAIGWAVDGPTRRENVKAMFIVSHLIDVPEKAMIQIKLIHESLAQHNIGRFRLSFSSASPELLSLKDVQVPLIISQILETEPSKRSLIQKNELKKYFRSSVPNEINLAEDHLTANKKKLADIKNNLPSVMVMKEGSPRETFMLIRGEYDKKGEKVGFGLPAILPPLPKDKPMNRLGLAYWMVDPSNPLTSRVWVNRMWEKFFGSGLVKTSENFGSQSEFPSHPELLDWLASEFMSLKWDIKAMHKLVVMSATYKQSSKVSPKVLEFDPENRLLSWAPRFRLPAEIVRDQALYTSGLLVTQIGGPSVRPYMPLGVWDETSVYGDLRNYKHDKGDSLYRKTMYTIWKRTAAPPTMLLFDAPNREACSIKRSRTNTPLQALALLNEITYIEAAKKLAEKMILEGGSNDESKLAFGFRMVTGRSPDPSELNILSKGYLKDYSFFKSEPDNAKSLISLGETLNNSKLDITELAAFTLTANVLFNLDEVVNRE